MDDKTLFDTLKYLYTEKHLEPASQYMVDTLVEITNSERGNLFIIMSNLVISHNPRIFPLTDEHEIPQSIMTTAMIKRYKILNASEISDKYFEVHNPKSIFCAPLIHKDVVGAVYLENGAYAIEKLDILLNHASPILAHLTSYKKLENSLYEANEIIAKQKKRIQEAELNIHLILANDPQIKLDFHLSQKEVFILQSLAKGKFLNQIAENLDVSSPTISNQITKLAKKMGAETRYQMIAIAVFYKIIKL